MLKKKKRERQRKDPCTDYVLNYSGSDEGESPKQEVLLKEIN